MRIVWEGVRGGVDGDVVMLMVNECGVVFVGVFLFAYSPKLRRHECHGVV